jgi:hypothetical protein
MLTQLTPSTHANRTLSAPPPTRGGAGAGIGFNAAVISIVTEWLSDIKMGYCSDGWWLNQQFCCWELDGDEDSGCDSWHLWSTVSVARWFIYVLFAVRFPFLPERNRTADVYMRVCESKRKQKQTGYVFLRRRSPRPNLGQVRGRLWDFGDQVHHIGFRHAWVPRLLDLPHQEFDIGDYS